MAEAVTSRSINQASESSGEHFSADSTAMAVWAAALGVAHSIQAAANASSQVVLADRKGNGVAVRGTHDSGHVDVFMSYNSKDQAAAEVIQKSLAATGVRVWLDTELHAGQITPQLNRIFACASAAMILVGKHGLGPWQEAELEALLELRGGDGKELQLVPVALPDANLECLPASVRTNAGVQFEKAVNEELALRRLFKLLTGQDWPHGTYEIHIEVEEIAVTCFAAVPSAGPDCICEPIKGAINEVNNHFNADIRFQCGAEDSVKLYRAIRSAELIVADCRRLEGTDDADPFVLYQVGLAQAIGKPIIVIVDPAGYPEELYPTPHFVHCDEGEGEWTRNLQEELVDRMQWLASHAILQLVAHDSVGITATCSNDHELRPLRIDGIRTVWRTGLAIQQSFREVAKHVHRLSDTVSNLQDDVKAANEEEETPDVTFQRIRSAFHSGLEGKFDAFQKFLDGDGVPLSLESLRGFAQNLSLDRASPQRDLTYDAFRLLKEKTVGQTSRHVRGAAVSFDRAVHKIDRSCQLSQQAAEAFVALRRRLDNGFDPEKSLGELADNVRALEVATQDINEYTVGMMSSLLEAME